MSILSLIEKKLGDEEIVTTSGLKEFGISNASAKKIIRKSGIQHVNLGNRTMFSKSDLMDFLKKTSEQSQK